MACLAALGLVLAAGLYAAWPTAEPEPANTDETVAALSGALTDAQSRAAALEALLPPQEQYEPSRRLLTALTAALEPHGVSLTVSGAGEVSVDAVRFAADSAQLTAEARRRLSEAFSGFLAALADPELQKTVREIRLTGYTNPQGRRQEDYTLSQSRARAVWEYVAGESFIALDTEQKQSLRPFISIGGFAAPRAVLDASGAVDEAASRRVCFCVALNVPLSEAQLAKMLAGDEIG
jgi:outer membrane protein OmpA-like peptidoglycan-associated protein